MSSTLDHYNRTANHYTQVNHDLAAVSPDRVGFLAQLRAQPDYPTDRPLRLLDAGSGSGRDTLAFIQEGFEVDAFDGSEAMVEVSTRLTGRPTRLMRFENMDLPRDHYDAIWAMASLLHVPRADLPGVLVTLGQSLRPGGLMFASFKHGHTDRVDEKTGRAFTDLDEGAVDELLKSIEGFELVATAHRDAPTTQSHAAPWFSMTLRRSGPEPTLKPVARRPRP